MENPIYRIRVEIIGDTKGVELSQTLKDGIECDGFAICANQGRAGRTVLHDITCLSVARLISGHDDLLAAAVIAKALREANDITASGKLRTFANALKTLEKAME